MRLTPELESLLRMPLGVLLQGEMPKPYELLRDTFGDAVIIAVGDVVDENIRAVGITPRLSIVDGKTKRRTVASERDPREDADVIVSNPKSNITRELWDAIRDCDLDNRKIFIDGEEDLATLPAIFFAPEGAIVVYGQPDEGIVIVNVTDEKKKEVYSILSRMEGEIWI
ncbi:MAG TPA: DUF359 domain-containing protein [Candidatus Methanofastidiosa archaeon]|nr:DUF359 domain-containing protein [Candidatus Methanofastidiosa archaeon]